MVGAIFSVGTCLPLRPSCYSVGHKNTIAQEQLDIKTQLIFYQIFLRLCLHRSQSNSCRFSHRKKPNILLERCLSSLLPVKLSFVLLHSPRAHKSVYEVLKVDTAASARAMLWWGFMAHIEHIKNGRDVATQSSSLKKQNGKHCPFQIFFLVRLSYGVDLALFSRRHVDACIKDALSCAVKIENEAMVIGILTNFCNNKKIKTLSDTTELVEHAIYSTAVEENSAILQTILKWNQVCI